MDFFGLKDQIHAEDHVMDLKIENFSLEVNDPKEKTLIPELFNGLYAFSVTVSPNGSCPMYAGYVSLLVKSSMTQNQDLDAMGSSNSMSCTASVVDISGEGRYSQSFGIENLIFTDSYIPGLETFIKRSTLLSQKGEFLPDDVLTMRFEFSFKTNKELAMLSKFAEFLPTLFVEPFNLNASDFNNAPCDFFDIFKDIAEKSDDECSGFACAKPVDSFSNDDKFMSVQISNSGINEVTGTTSQLCDFQIHKLKEDAGTSVTEMQAENKKQILDGVIHTENDSVHSSKFGLQKGNVEQISGLGALIENEAIPKCTNLISEREEIEKDQTSMYESIEKERELNEIDDGIILDERKISNKLFEVEEKCYEGQPPDISESVEQRLRQLEKSGDETTKNILIVVNGHRMFLKFNRSPKNKIDFFLTTDDELYKMFYSIESLEEEECRSIYRMHGTVPFFRNLMDRDETALFYVPKNEEDNLQKNIEDHGNTLCPTGETMNTKNIPNESEVIEIKKLGNLQYTCNEKKCLPSKNFGSDSEESKRIIEGNKTTTASGKNVDKIDARNEESAIEEENVNEGKFDFVIQTADDVTVPVPFERGGETIGSKLLVASAVFENMLRHPMKETTDRRVELNDATSTTVNNLLSYIDSGKFQDIPLPDAYDLYEAADKYAIKSLMNVPILCHSSQLGRMFGVWLNLDNYTAMIIF